LAKLKRSSAAFLSLHRRATFALLPHHHPRGLARKQLPCRKHSRSSTRTRYPARIRRTPSPRRRRAGGLRVSNTPGPWGAEAGSSNKSADTAFRQQRLKAWQYVRCDARIGSARPLLTRSRQAHLNPEDGPPAVLHRRRHIRAHWRASAVCEHAGEHLLWASTGTLR
jgi:hypothetical protein